MSPSENRNYGIQKTSQGQVVTNALAHYNRREGNKSSWQPPQHYHAHLYSIISTWDKFVATPTTITILLQVYLHFVLSHFAASITSKLTTPQHYTSTGRLQPPHWASMTRTCWAWQGTLLHVNTHTYTPVHATHQPPSFRPPNRITSLHYYNSSDLLRLFLFHLT